MSPTSSLAGLRLSFIGAGNMAEALVRGLTNAGTISDSEVVVTDTRAERLDLFREKYDVRGMASNVEAVRDADLVILAVKPQIIDGVCSEIADHLEPRSLVISFAAGIPTTTLAQHLGPDTRIYRAMPNICAVVGEAATAVAAGQNATEQDLDKVRAIFSAVGKVVETEEDLLDAVTGLSGSGPAYVFMIIEALSDAGVKVGLPRYQAQILAAQTVLGSAKLLIQTGEHPGVLKDQVTSPGGTAITGLHTLEEGGLRTTLINAVVEATKRSQELGESK